MNKAPDTYPASVIDLLHPDGVARDVAILGGSCPAYLCDGGRATSSPGPGAAAATLIVPTERECRTAGWLERTADDVAALLHTDGVAYAIVERRWRRGLVRAVRRRGLEVAATFIHARHGSSSDYLIPCDTHVARYVGMHVPMNAARGRAWHAVWALPRASSIIPYVLSDIGLVIRHPRARPLFQWLDDGGDRLAQRAPKALIRVKARGDAATAVVSLFARATPSPSIVLKAALTDASSVARAQEAQTLAKFAEAVESSGARLPRSSQTTLPSGRPMLHLQALPGQPASAVLGAAPDRLGVIVERIATWLERWALETRRDGIADLPRLEREVVEPATTLAPLLTGGDVYVAALRVMCARAIGTPLPSVCTHGDLSMSNVLLQGEEPLAIVDWESARGNGLPLTDFFYAAADMAAAAHGYRNRMAAFVECSDPVTDAGRLVWAAAQRLSGSLGVAKDTLVLLWHATWLQHAVSELRLGRSAHQPFREMVQHLCTQTIAQQAAA